MDCAAITVHNPIAQDEPTVALAQVDEHRELHEARLTTSGGQSVSPKEICGRVPPAGNLAAYGVQGRN